MQQILHCVQIQTVDQPQLPDRGRAPPLRPRRGAAAISRGRDLRRAPREPRRQPAARVGAQRLPVGAVPPGDGRGAAHAPLQRVVGPRPPRPRRDLLSAVFI